MNGSWFNLSMLAYPTPCFCMHLLWNYFGIIPTLYGNVVTELKDIPTFWIYELYWLLMSSNELFMSSNVHLTKSYEHK